MAADVFPACSGVPLALEGGAALPIHLAQSFAVIGFLLDRYRWQLWMPRGFPGHDPFPLVSHLGNNFSNLNRFREGLDRLTKTLLVQPVQDFTDNRPAGFVITAEDRRASLRIAPPPRQSASGREYLGP